MLSFPWSVNRMSFQKLLTIVSILILIQSQGGNAQSSGLVLTTPSQDKPFGFSVISVRHNTLGKSGSYSFPAQGDGLTIIDLTLEGIIASAFNVRPDRISGIPDWAKEQRFDLLAKVDDSDLLSYQKLPRSQQLGILQILLTDKFGLKFHKSAKDDIVYELRIAKHGPLVKSSSSIAPPEGATHANSVSPSLVPSGRGKINAKAVPISLFCQWLSVTTGRRVINKTELLGSFDFTLQWMPGLDEDMGDNSAPSLFTALQQQLGLKLVDAKGSVETLVVDHVEEPAEN